MILTNSNLKSLQQFLKKNSPESLRKIEYSPSKLARWLTTFTTSGEGEFRKLMAVADEVEGILKVNSFKISRLIKQRKSLLEIIRFLRSIEKSKNRLVSALQEKVLRLCSEICIKIKLGIAVYLGSASCSKTNYKPIVVSLLPRPPTTISY